MPTVPSPSRHDNPYAPPAAELRVASPEQCWRDGRHIVLRRGGDLPERCLRCNRPGLPRLRGSTYSWLSPWYFVLIPLNILVFVLVALLVRKTVRLHPVLCSAHRRERRRDWMLFLVLMVGGFLALAGALSARGTGAPEVAALALAPLLLALAIVLAARKLGELTVTRLDQDWVRLRGAGQPFLDSLPPWDGLPPRR